MPCSDDIINIMMVFFDKYGPIFQVYFKNLAFLTQIMKTYAIVEISTEKRIICDTESINMWI